MKNNPRNQIKIQVKLADFLSKLVPEAMFEVKIHAGTTVQELVTILTERFDENFRRAILDRNGKLNADIAIVIDNRFIPPQQMTEHAIHESSYLNIIPIAGGG